VHDPAILDNVEAGQVDSAAAHPGSRCGAATAMARDCLYFAIAGSIGFAGSHAKDEDRVNNRSRLK
jgi:hypothetical protein